MKKLLAACMILVLSFSMFACGAKTPAADSDMPNQTEDQEQVGEDGADPEDAKDAARVCALNALAAAASVAGGIDNLAGVVKVVGFVSSRPDFYGQAGVINGASELFGEIFGSQHARSAVGVAALPLNVSVEVEAEFLIK